MINRIAVEPYAEDVIAEYGNNTWYKKGDTVKLYIPAGSGTLYYRLKGAQTWSSTPVTGTQMDITGLISSVPGNYELTTDTSAKVFCLLNIVYVGTSPGNKYTTLTAASGSVPETGLLSVSGYSGNITPVWYQLYRRTSTPAHYYYEDKTGMRMEIIEENGHGYMMPDGTGCSAVITAPSDSWCARVYFQTGFGYCWCEIYP